MNRYEFYSKLESFKAKQSNAELTHYGIKGQKWGQRRWQNTDGTFNEAGKERYWPNAKHRDSYTNSLNKRYKDRPELLKSLKEGNKSGKIKRKLYDIYGLSASDYDSVDEMNSIDHENMKRFSDDFKKSFKKLNVDSNLYEVANDKYGEPHLRYSKYKKQIDDLETKQHELYDEYFKLPYKSEEASKYKNKIDAVANEINEIRAKESKKINKISKEIKEDIINVKENEVNIEDAKRYANEILEYDIDNMRRTQRNAYYDKDGALFVRNLINSGYGKENIKPVLDEYWKNIKDLNEEVYKIIPSYKNPKSAEYDNIAGILNRMMKHEDATAWDLFRCAGYSGPDEDDEYSYVDGNDVAMLKDGNGYLEKYRELKDTLYNNLDKAVSDLNLGKNGQKFKDILYEDSILKRGIHYDDNTLYNGEHYDEPVNPRKYSKIEDMKKNLSKAESEYTKLLKAKDNLNDNKKSKNNMIWYDWRLFKQAMENLGYDKIPAKKLTDSQWDKIYKECSNVGKIDRQRRADDSRIFNKKHDIYLNLENNFGEMMYFTKNWDYTKEAKKNLGYDKIEDKDLTDTQWDNIKKEVMENTGKAKYQEYLKDMKRMYG